MKQANHKRANTAWVHFLSQIYRDKVEWWGQGLGKEGAGELVFNGYRVLVMQDEKISGDRCCDGLQQHECP